MFIFAEYYSFRIFSESVNTLEIFLGGVKIYMRFLISEKLCTFPPQLWKEHEANMAFHSSCQTLYG